MIMVKSTLRYFRFEEKILSAQRIYEWKIYINICLSEQFLEVFTLRKHTVRACTLYDLCVLCMQVMLCTIKCTFIFLFKLILHLCLCISDIRIPSKLVRFMIEILENNNYMIPSRCVVSWLFRMILKLAPQFDIRTLEKLN